MRAIFRPEAMSMARCASLLKVKPRISRRSKTKTLSRPPNYFDTALEDQLAKETTLTAEQPSLSPAYPSLLPYRPVTRSQCLSHRPMSRPTSIHEGSVHSRQPSTSSAGNDPQTIRQQQPVRPSLARLSRTSAAHHSSPSIMTMSKMYREQKEQYEREHFQSQNQTSVHPAQTSRSPRIRNLMQPSQSSSKNLQKRVLSPAKHETEYFTRSKRDSSSGSSSSASESNTPAPKLPTFHRHSGSIDSMDLLHPNFKPKSLSSSKIYDRRMKQLHEDPEDDVVDITDSQLPDQEVSKHYDEKLSQIAPRYRSKAEFFPGDSEESEDIDINSEEDEHPVVTITDPSGSEKKTEETFRFPEISSRETKDIDAQSTSSSNNNQHKKRNFFQRVAFGEEDEFDHIAPDDNIFTRMIGSGGRRITDPEPHNKTTKEDEELAVGTPTRRPSPPQHRPLDSELFKREAQDIVASHNYARSNTSSNNRSGASDDTTLGSSSGYFLAPNPDYYIHEDDDNFNDNLDGAAAEYVSPPEKVRGGVLSSLLRLYDNPWEQASRSKVCSPDGFSPESSFPPTPSEDPSRRDGFDAHSLTSRLRTYASSENASSTTLPHRRTESLVSMFKVSTNDFGKKKRATASTTNLPSFNRTQRKPNEKRPRLRKGASVFKAKREQAKAKITVHIADVLHRQRFILRMCKALMLYGAPTHRLEEYLTMTSRVLEIDGQFIYLPGCMVVSFGDPITRTSEVQLVKCVQGLDLYKLHRIQRIYKQVIHDIVSVDEASVALENLLTQKPTFPPWMCVLLYGFSSAMVTPFAFGGGWVNLPVAFGTGCIVGFLQYVVSPRSQLYINVFEVAASIIVSFVARALGSIEGSGICFSSVTQGCLALILPGWFILCGALELQSRNLVAGSVRMFYAIIYSMFLGYGITLGSALYGWIDSNATSATTCSDSLSPWYRFLFVPGFTIGLALINQARLFQLPVIIFIAGAGHAVSYFASKRFYNSTQITAAMGSFVIGILGNLYSRVFKGIAFSAMLPAVFVQIPAGISSAGSLLSGVQSANQIVSNSTTVSTSDQAYNALSVGMTLINVCIGITVGLFVSAIVVYPFGKRSTSIFTL